MKADAEVVKEDVKAISEDVKEAATEVKEDIKSEAVSYTHLTLPTSDLV